MVSFIVFLGWMIGSEAFSEDHAAYALKQAEQLQAEANKLIGNGEVTENLFATYKPKQSCASSLFTLTGKSANATSFRKILIFVSFSMPEVSLKSLAEEAQKHNAILVMRGLYEDSFAKTTQKLKDLNLTVDIHPELFETHGIISVPTFIELKDNKAIQQLSGNVSLPFCLTKFEERP